MIRRTSAITCAYLIKRELKDKIQSLIGWLNRLSYLIKRELKVKVADEEALKRLKYLIKRELKDLPGQVRRYCCSYLYLIKRELKVLDLYVLLLGLANYVVSN